MRKKIIFVFITLNVFIGTYSQNLDYFLDKGLQNSPLLKDYQNQISSATMDSLMVTAGQRPQVNLNAGLLYAPSFNNGTNGYDQAITNGGTYSTTIGVQQYILNRKTLATKYEDITLTKRSLSIIKKLSTNDLKRVITNQYLAVYSDYTDLTFNQSFLKLMFEEKDIIQKLAMQGVYKQTDYLSLFIQTQSQEILVNQMKAQMVKDNHLLNQLCGLNDSAKLQFSLPSISKKEQVDLSISPLFMQYKLDSLKIINNKTTVDVRYQPKISWTADAGFLSSTVNNIYQHFGFSAGVNLSIPIYDGRQRKLDYQKLVISEDTRSNYQAFFMTQYSQQILQFNDDLLENKKVIEQLKTQLKSAQELIDMAKAQLNSGNMPITEFIDAAKNYININSSLAKAQLRDLQLINELNYLMQ